MTTQAPFSLWDEKTLFPATDGLSAPPGLRETVVHRADPAFGFLHDNAVAWHDGTLFAAWYNCPAWEMAESSCIRGRWSKDGGRTWGDPEVVASDTAGKGILYVPAVLLSHRGTLWAFVGNMTGPDLITRCEAFSREAASGRWISHGPIAGPFLPNHAPVKMANGDFIMAGRMAEAPGRKPEQPAVAVSRGGELASPWRVIPIRGEGPLPAEPFPETTLWLDGPDLTAILRGGGIFTSHDFGNSWSGPFRHNLPAEASKLYAGTLSTGQRYLVWNRPDPGQANRNWLVLAVGRPGERTLSKMWTLQRGFNESLQAGPEWSYPCAIEHAGSLYVLYTSEKKHSVMSVIPLESLA